MKTDVSKAVLDRLFALADSLSFELDGVAEDSQDNEWQSIAEYAEKIYDFIDKKRCAK